MHSLAHRIAIAILSMSLFSIASQAAEIELYPDEKGGAAVIFISGEIRSGDEDKFRKIAATTNDAIVSLNSGGGTIIAAMEIGKIIRLRDYTTAIDKSDSCASACALIWISGAKRFIFEGGKVGFHASYLDTDGKRIETGLGNALVGHYLSQLGFGQRAVVFATAASPDKILWLDKQNSASAGIDFVELPSQSGTKLVEVTPSTPAPSTTPVVTTQIDQIKPDTASERGTWLATSNITIRNVDAFSEELKKRGYQSQISYSKEGNPRILTGAGGNKIVLAFSSCVKNNCDYVELLAFYTDIIEEQFFSASKKYATEENFAGIYYNKDEKNLYAYHYIILGTDGITITNLIENINYFSKEFDRIGKLIVE